MNNAACTIVSKNYFAYAKTLKDSFLKNHPDNKFYILIVDLKDDEFLKDCREHDVMWVEDLEIPNFLSYAFRYDILELNTNVKPTLLRRLLTVHQKVLYLDPDIEVFQPLDLIYGRLDTSSVVLTPHITRPITDSMKPGEDSFLQAGDFNLGFVGVKADETGNAFLTWWQERCLEVGYNDLSVGLFVDQKWANLVPCLFPDVHVERSVSCNMAYWNLHERALEFIGGKWIVNGSTPLLFFHFSGLNLKDRNQISKYQDRFDLKKRPDLLPLFDTYRDKLAANRFDHFLKYPYSFGKFSDGSEISPLARRVYSIAPSSFAAENPFSEDSDVFAFCKKKKLFGVAPKTYTTYNTNNNDVRLKIFRSILKFARFFLGNERYLLLLRYMLYIAPVRRQKEIFFD